MPMNYTWDQAFGDGREAALVGGNAEKLLDASRRLSLAGNTSASCFVEAPLLGAPDYDSLVIHNPRSLYPGCRVADPSQELAQTVLSWAAGREGDRPYIHFELDSAGAGALSGVHCRMEGDMALAEGFFRAVGDPWRAGVLAWAVDRLPQGWFCSYAGVFPGRETGATRMEVNPADEITRRALCDKDYLRGFFDGLGFTAYDDRMLCDLARLAEVDVPVSIQFDLLPDGFLPVCSFLSLYEHVRPDCSPLFRPDGGLTRSCRIYEEMGVSDGRWRLLEQCCFSQRRIFLKQNVLEKRFNRCFMCCTKAKWISAARSPAKFYLLMDVVRVFCALEDLARGGESGTRETES